MTRATFQMINDAQLGVVLRELPDARHKRFAPDLNLLFLIDHRPISTTAMTRDAFMRLSRPWLMGSPMMFHAIGLDLYTNRDPDPRVALCVLDPAFFEQFRGQLGDEIICGVPSPTRVLFTRKTEKHRLALRLMLDGSPKVEAITVSLRTYVTTRSERGWSPVSCLS